MDDLLNLPKRVQLDETIELLEKIDLSKISYEKICSILSNDIRLMPIDRMVIKKGTNIFRGRINKGSLFSSESEISYNPFPESIKEYGRFNIPNQQVFYGLILLPENEKELISQSIYCEIKNNSKTKNEVFLLTIGRWEVIKDFDITTTLFEDSNIVELIKKYPDKIYEIERIINFYSQHIKKAISRDNHNQYKLTAANANDIFTHVKNCHGIVYHSVETALKGRNVALLPEAIDSFCELKETRLYLAIEKEGFQPFFKEIMRANELGELCSSFKWILSNNI
jgi:hypothetical protein